ncbi:MAG: hypothetical protein AABZ33_03875 [Chloroflexota bacterium]
MIASEFAFMTLGLLLGVASGAALVFVIRARSPAPREVRLRVATDVIPRRTSATLAGDAFGTAPGEPARGGPADRRTVDREPNSALAPAAPSRPNTLRVAGEPGPVGALGVTAAVERPALAVPLDAVAIAIPIHGERDPMLQALRESTERALMATVPATRPEAADVGTHGIDRAEQTAPQAAMRTAPQAEARSTPGATALVEPRAGAVVSSGGAVVSSGGAVVSSAESGGSSRGEATRSRPVADGPCAEAQARADEQCRQAEVARLGATTAAAALAVVRREYSEQQGRAEESRSAAEPRRVQERKEAARAGFRSDRLAAADRAGLETAARTWLTAINAINAAAREAAPAVARADLAAAALLPTLERLGAEADAARISAEAADAECLEARTTLAQCREAAAIGQAISPVRTGGDAPGTVSPAPLRRDAGTPIVLRLVAGDRNTRTQVAAALAQSLPDTPLPWADLLGEFVDAISARAIEESLLDVPADHPFWSPFARTEGRDILAALAALGYRFDGLGGWADDRIPSQRDLSLAVGYAGQDPMRIRSWPSEQETTELLRDVRVAGDEYLDRAGGDLSLGEVVALLGPRADALTDLWNAWGTVRPLLVAPIDATTED